VPTGQLTFLVTELGKPFTAAGFGNWFRDRRREAGIPEGYSAHGLRKAFLTFGSNLKLTSQELAALAGHRTLKEVERYTRARTAAFAHAGGARIAEALSKHDPLRQLVADENDPSTKLSIPRFRRHPKKVDRIGVDGFHCRHEDRIRLSQRVRARRTTKDRPRRTGRASRRPPGERDPAAGQGLADGLAARRAGVKHQHGAPRGVSSEDREYGGLVVRLQVEEAVPGEQAVETRVEAERPHVGDDPTPGGHPLAA